MGHRDLAAMGADPGLDRLLGRGDFIILMLDPAFPAEPLDRSE
jgi:hypothetical protein